MAQTAQQVAQPKTQQEVLDRTIILLDEANEIKKNEKNIENSKQKSIEKAKEIMEVILSEPGIEILKNHKGFCNVVLKKMQEFRKDIPVLADHWEKKILSELEEDEPEVVNEEVVNENPNYLEILENMDFKLLDFETEKGYYDTNGQFYHWEGDLDENMFEYIDEIDMYEMIYNSAKSYKVASKAVIDLCNFLNFDELTNHAIDTFPGLMYVMENNLLWYYRTLSDEHRDILADRYKNIFGFTIEDKVNEMVNIKKLFLM